MSTVMKTTRDVKGIGLSIPRPDGPDKVSGQVQYVADLNPRGLLHAKLLRSPHAHAKVTKLESSGTWFRPMRSNRAGRMMVFGGLGTSFDGHPLVIDQFELGGPARLTAFGIGEARGDHYVYAGAGYLHPKCAKEYTKDEQLLEKIKTNSTALPPADFEALSKEVV